MVGNNRVTRWKLSRLSEVAIAAIPVGIIPSWEIQKEGGDVDECI